MNQSYAFYRNADNELIICLNSAFSTLKTWNSLMVHLGNSHTISTANSGYHLDSEITLDNDTDLLENQARQVADLIDRQTCKVHVLAHSFAAVVALKIAQRQPDNLASLILIEPTSIHFLRQSNTKDDQLYRQVCEMTADLSGAVCRGDYWGGMNQLVNDWSARNIWNQFDGQKKLELANAYERIPLELWSCMNNKSTFDELDLVNVPLLILCGTASPEPFRRVSCLINETIETARHRTISNAGHLMLLTHQIEIAKHINQHFDQLAAEKSINRDIAENFVNQQVV